MNTFLFMYSRKNPAQYIFILIVSLSCFACGKVVESGEQFTITSSTHLLHLSEALARGFKQEQGKAIVVKGTLGKEHELLNKELTQLIVTTEKLSNEYIQFEENPIAFDQTVVIIHPSNKLTKLSKEQLTEIFTGKATNWNDFGGNNTPIQILSRESGASIKRTFEQNFLELHEDQQLSLKALAVNSNPEMRSAISKIPGGIGYVSSGALDSSVQKLKIVKGNTKFEVKAPKVTIFAIWKAKNETLELKEFLEYLAHSPTAKKIIQEEGYRAP
ncbi:MAG: substrate-binding domain-containing protein [Candidatus Caenarcaniphilales bacterium]|nr:substrate-binding domain-containing protein [Candidatus Caenarcaniphilales bacterium]